MMIDAKTGEVIRHGFAGDQPTPPAGYEPGKVVEGWEPNPGPDPPKNFGKPLPTSIYAAMALFTFGCAVLAYAGTKRWMVR